MSGCSDMHHTQQRTVKCWSATIFLDIANRLDMTSMSVKSSTNEDPPRRTPLWRGTKKAANPWRLATSEIEECGETGIRTRDTLLTYTRFPGVPLQPLEHLSLADCSHSSGKASEAIISPLLENGCKGNKKKRSTALSAPFISWNYVYLTLRTEAEEGRLLTPVLWVIIPSTL